MFLKLIGTATLVLVATISLFTASSSHVSYSNYLDNPHDIPVITPGTTMEEAMKILNANGYYYVIDNDTMTRLDAQGIDYSFLFEQKIYQDGFTWPD